MRDSFVFYQSFYEAMAPLEPEAYKRVMEAVCVYALNGENTELPGIEKSLLMLMKPIIDSAASRYLNAIRAGKESAAKKSKTEGTEGHRPGNDLPTEGQRPANDLPTEGQLNVNADVNANVNENADADADENLRRQEEFIQKIKDSSAKAGVFLTDNLAKDLAGRIDPSFVEGEHSIFLFFMGKIQKAHPKTEKESLKRLYYSALWNKKKGDHDWADLWDEYQYWKEDRIAAEERKRLQYEENHPPDTCPQCGGKLNNRECAACGGILRWDGEEKKHVLEKKSDFWDGIPPEILNGLDIPEKPNTAKAAPAETVEDEPDIW
ncbi:MAG: DUF6291 domain-containing protein [Treponema sp.]|jgi:hypothetical protein|nr:DUF6291 domain-containing protein [Treponema sp.]